MVSARAQKAACWCLRISPQNVQIARPQSRAAYKLAQVPRRRHLSVSACRSAEVIASEPSEPVASTSAAHIEPESKVQEELIPGLLYAVSAEELKQYRIVEASAETIHAFFREKLAPLQFEKRLQIRAMTHPLAAGPQQNHNGKLASTGSHVLRAHLAAFVNLHRAALPDDIEIESGWLSEMLTQQRLGEGPGNSLSVHQAMRYRETLGVLGDFPRSTHRGQILEALTGLIYRQYGAATSLRWFTSRVLPHLAFPQEWSSDVARAAEQDRDLSGTSSYLQDKVLARRKRLLKVA